MTYTPAAAALSPERAVTQYVRDVWSSQDGLPQGSVLALRQTSDGYLWVGASSCVARFDGRQFVQFPAGAAGLGQASFPRDLLEDPEGNLWMAFVGGAARFDGRRFEWFDERSGFTHPFVYSIARRGAQIWAGTGGAGVWKFRDGRFELDATYGRDPRLPGKVNDLEVDGRGLLWAATDSGLVTLGETPRRFTISDGLPSEVVNTILIGRDGGLWAGTRRGLVHSDDGVSFETVPGVGDENTSALLEDQQGNLWVGTNRSLLRRTSQGIHAMPGDFEGVTALAEDRSGSLWVGTSDGLERFRDGAFVTTGRKEGLPEENVLSILRKRSGGLWMLDASGVVWEGDGKRFATVAGADRVSGTGMLGLAETDDGSLWIASTELLQLRDGQLARHSHPGGAFSVLEPEGAGLLAVQTTTDGRSTLHRFFSGSFSPISTGVELRHVQRLHRDRQGRLWISTGGTGLVRFSDAGTKVFGVKDGLPSDTVYGLAEDDAGGIWLATRGGIAKIVDDDVKSFANITGAPTRSPVHVQLDGLGYLWVTADDGVYRISLAVLNDVAAGESVSADIFTTRQGLRSVEISWRSGGQAMVDGRIYYATARGLTRVDPRALQRPTGSPSVRIDAVRVGGHEADPTTTELSISDRRDPSNFATVPPSSAATAAWNFERSFWATMQLGARRLHVGVPTMVISQLASTASWSARGYRVASGVSPPPALP